MNFQPFLGEEIFLPDNVSDVPAPLPLSDWALAYLAVVFLLAILLIFAAWLRGRPGEAEFLLAGRSQGWFLSTWTILALVLGPWPFFLLPGFMYRDGVAFCLTCLQYPLIGLGIYFLGGPLWRVSRAFQSISPGDVLERYYGTALVRMLALAAAILALLPLGLWPLHLIGWAIQQLFDGSPAAFNNGVALTAAGLCLLFFAGGLRGQVWGHVLQAVLGLGVLFLVGRATFLLFDGSADFNNQLLEELPDPALTLPGQAGQWTWPTLFAWVTLGAAGLLLQPAVWLRFHAARGMNSFRGSAMLVGVLLAAALLGGTAWVGLAALLRLPLDYRHRVVVSSAPPAMLTIPANLKKHFEYDPPTAQGPARIGWKWQGKTREMGEEVERQLLALHPTPGYADAVKDLVRRVNDYDFPAEISTAEEVDPTGREFSGVLFSLARFELPADRALRSYGAPFAALLYLGVWALAAAVLDSQIHALSTLGLRDLYVRWLRPGSPARERNLIARLIALCAMVGACWLLFERTTLTTAASLTAVPGGLDELWLALVLTAAWGVQLLPAVVDLAYLRRGTAAGVCCGLLASGALAALATLTHFPHWMQHPNLAWVQPLHASLAPYFALLPLPELSVSLLGNFLVFALVSLITPGVDPARKAEVLAALQPVPRRAPPVEEAT